MFREEGTIGGGMSMTSVSSASESKKTLSRKAIWVGEVMKMGLVL